VLAWQGGRVAASVPAVSPGAAPRVEDFETALDGLEAVLGRALAARLPPAGRFAVFLSGGIDSALLCALAAARAPGRVEAFTIGFEEPAFDEAPVAARIAAGLGVPHRVVRFSMAEYHAAFERWVAGIDYPFADPAALPTLLGYEACRQSYDVAIDGTGADTLLGVMPARHARLATAYGALVPAPLRRRLAEALAWVGPLSHYRPLLDFDDPEEVLIRWKGFTRREVERLCGGPVSLSDTRFYRVYRSFPRTAHLERYSALLGNLPDDRVHQSALLTGLRIRMPYLANEVQAYVRALPTDYRYTAAEPKRVLRALLARYLPPSAWNLPKHGFDFPFAALLRYQDMALVRCYGASSGRDAPGLFDEAVVREHLDRFEAGDDAVAFKVWALVVLQAWLAHHAELFGEVA
jgi:asparagine synthase (glutamine-hydrolysing)